MPTSPRWPPVCALPLRMPASKPECKRWPAGCAARWACKPANGSCWRCAIIPAISNPCWPSGMPACVPYPSTPNCTPPNWNTYCAIATPAYACRKGRSTPHWRPSPVAWTRCAWWTWSPTTTRRRHAAPRCPWSSVPRRSSPGCSTPAARPASPKASCSATPTWLACA
ncbi:hypothetical protein G6F68_017455 [Rhizopus microsporus]|nr:hypothetical protein G6F68_017455 [Rhizopus microsporus]